MIIVINVVVIVIIVIIVITVIVMIDMMIDMDLVHKMDTTCNLATASHHTGTKWEMDKVILMVLTISTVLDLNKTNLDHHRMAIHRIITMATMAIMGMGIITNQTVVINNKTINSNSKM